MRALFHSTQHRIASIFQYQCSELQLKPPSYRATTRIPESYSSNSIMGFMLFMWRFVCRCFVPRQYVAMVHLAAVFEERHMHDIAVHLAFLPLQLHVRMLLLIGLCGPHSPERSEPRTLIRLVVFIKRKNNLMGEIEPERLRPHIKLTEAECRWL